MDSTPYELHATIATPGNVEDLKQWVVHDYGFQFHKIENFCRDGSSLTEYIATYEQDYQDLSEAQSVLESFTNDARKQDHIVVRSKIETVPWSPEIKQDQLPELYLESHTKIRSADFGMVWERGFHVSRVNDSPWTTITRRSAVLLRPELDLDLHLNLVYLMNSGYLVGSTQVEYCLMDTNPALDDKWLRT